MLGEVSSEALAVLAEAETLGGILQATINGAVGHEDALETYVRTLAWVSLSGQDSRDYQKDFPAMALAMGDQSPEHRAQVLLIMAAAFGWEIFSRHLAAMVGYRSERVAGEALKCALKDAGRSVL